MKPRELLTNLKTSAMAFPMRIASEPLFALRVQYIVYRGLIAFVGLIIAWQIIQLIIGTNGGSSILLKVVYAFTGIIIIGVIYMKLLAPLKKQLKHEEASGTLPRKIDVASEVDEILAKFGEN